MRKKKNHLVRADFLPQQLLQLPELAALQTCCAADDGNDGLLW